MSKQFLIQNQNLGYFWHFDTGFFVLVPGSWVSGPESWVLDPRFWILDPQSKFADPWSYFSVYLVIIGKCDKVITKCGRYYKVWQSLQSET